MYTVAARIPFVILGLVQYVNVAFTSSIPLDKGIAVKVRNKADTLGRQYEAEIIESVGTAKGDDFRSWERVR